MNDEQAIRDLVQLWISATQAGDTAAVLRLMADDVLFLVPGREPFGKKTFIAAVESMKGADRRTQRYPGAHNLGRLGVDALSP